MGVKGLFCSSPSWGSGWLSDRHPPDRGWCQKEGVPSREVAVSANIECGGCRLGLGFVFGVSVLCDKSGNGCLIF